jgi:predicted nucleic acid-binding protein
METVDPTAAYIDSSALVAITRVESAARFIARRLADFSVWVSSNLLAAEMRAVFARDWRAFESGLLHGIEWVLPNRPLHAEITAVLQAGYLRGADLWHVANALYASRAMPGLAFITLDQRQQTVAASLGFVT